MNVEKLQRTIKREFTKSPVKTLVLIAMCPVALYFCLPVFWRWMPHGQTAKVVQKPHFVAPSTAGTGEPEARANVRGNETGHGWRELVRWMEQDLSMASATLPPDMRSPFQISPQQRELAAVQEKPQDQESAGDVQRSPEELGLVLTATMIGPGVRLATISGRTYRQESPVVVSAENRAGGPGKRESEEVTFTLSEVTSRFVVLRRNDKQYRLQLKGTQLASGDIVIVHGNTSR